jgi:hypothetical protein
MNAKAYQMGATLSQCWFLGRRMVTELRNIRSSYGDNFSVECEITKTAIRNLYLVFGFMVITKELLQPDI